METQKDASPRPLLEVADVLGVIIGAILIGTLLWTLPGILLMAPNDLLKRYSRFS